MSSDYEVDTKAASGFAKLTPLNWVSWHKTLRLTLRGRDLLGVLDPAAVPAGPPTDPEVIAWKKKEDRAAYIIALSCSPSIQSKVLNKDSPLEMLEVAREECQSQSFTNMARLLKQLVELGTGPRTDMRKHMEEADTIFENLSGVGYPLTEKAKIAHLLATLPQAYSDLHAAMDILGANAKYGQLQGHIKEAEHRKNGYAAQAQKDLAMVAYQAPNRPSPGGGASKKVKCHYCKKLGHYKNDCRKRIADEGKGKERAAYANEQHIYMGQAMVCAETQGPRSQLTFVIDSGATRHIVTDRRWFTRYEPVEAGRVITTANGASMPILGMGTVTICMGDGKKISIAGTAYVPSAVTNLLSVDKMVDEGFSVTFGDKVCRIARPDQTLVFTARREGGQYVVKAFELGDGEALTSQEDLRGQAMLEHERLGHLHAAGMRELQESGALSKMPIGYEALVELLKGCGGCRMGKQTAKGIKEVEHSRASREGELYHADVIGPVTPAAHDAIDSARFALVVEDDKTRYLWTFPLQFKSQVTNTMVGFILTMERAHPDRPIAALRTDNGTEFVNAELSGFLKKRGITHQRSAPYKPQSNGVVERANRTLIETARCLLQGRNLDLRLWSAAFVTAAYIRNRTPSRALTNGQTPHKAFFGRDGRALPLRVFGSTCWTLDNKKESKFAAKSTKMLFIGYAHSDTYRLWDPVKEKVVISRDVAFDEADRGPKLLPAAPQPEPSTITVPDLGPAPNANTAQFADRVQAAQAVIRQRVAEAQERARELVNQREQAVPSQQPPAPPAQQVEQSSPQEEPERRTSRRLAGEGPEVEKALLAAAVDVEEQREDPKTVEQARKREDWKKWEEAIQKELGSLEETGTYEWVEAPEGANILTGKWVFKIKRNPDGSVSKYKARFVARGYAQVEGVDYDETHAPTARMATVRAICAIAACDDLELSQFDYDTAYLNGPLHAKVYMHPPEGTESRPGKVWRLIKALYGLKQAGREWNLVLVELLTDLGFKQSKTDASLFVRTDPSFVAIIVYVDDLIIAAAKGTDMGELKRQLAQRFKGKDLGEAHHLLGIEIRRDREKKILTMSQGRYAREVLARFGMSNCKPAKLPMQSKISLMPRREGEPAADKATYRAIVGSLMYLVMGTRGDLAFYVSLLGRFASDPSEEHMAAAKHLMRNIKLTADAKLTFDGSDGLRITAYVDADWAGDRSDRKSTSGFAILMAGAAVTWGSKKQTAVALSTTEAEYIAAGVAGREAIALTALLRDVGKPVEGIEILCDNQAAICVSKNPVLHSRTKHIDIAHHWIKDAVNQKQLSFTYVPTDENPADLLTKALPLVKVEGHRRKLGVVLDGVEDGGLGGDDEEEAGRGGGGQVVSR
ncbi:hypothetical protein A4X13_0g8029 [Tilletia indica]|uniref:Uncharacterized protein n=1 Tax=Tilletia indica TaxID=43049 RepID=A0A177T2I3_9BASI|nr:hypothetical protein A4X13_0g8029 [Tilletia indica]